MRRLPFDDELFPRWLCSADDGDDDGAGAGDGGKAADDDGGPGGKAPDDDGGPGGKAPDDDGKTDTGKAPDDDGPAGKDTTDTTDTGTKDTSTGDTGTAGERDASFGSGSTDKSVADDDGQGAAAPASDKDTGPAGGDQAQAEADREAARADALGGLGGGVSPEAAGGTPSGDVAAAATAAGLPGGVSSISDILGQAGQTPIEQALNAANQAPGTQLAGTFPDPGEEIMPLGTPQAPVGPNAPNTFSSPGNLPAWVGTVDPSSNLMVPSDAVSAGLAPPGSPNTMGLNATNANFGPAAVASALNTSGFAPSSAPAQAQLGMQDPVAQADLTATPFPGPTTAVAPNVQTNNAAQSTIMPGAQPALAAGSFQPSSFDIVNAPNTQGQTQTAPAAAPSGPAPGPGDTQPGGTSPSQISGPAAPSAGPGAEGVSSNVAAALNSADGAGASVDGGSAAITPQSLVQPIPGPTPADGGPVQQPITPLAPETSEDGGFSGNFNPQEGLFLGPGLPGGPSFLPGGVIGPIPPPIPDGSTAADGSALVADGGSNMNPNEGLFTALNSADGQIGTGNINPNEGIT